jgi:hypothetical protein
LFARTEVGRDARRQDKGYSFMSHIEKFAGGQRGPRGEGLSHLILLPLRANKKFCLIDK